MQVNVYHVISKGRQEQLCKQKLQQEWMAEEQGRSSYQWPIASAEAVDLVRKEFPLQTFRHTGKVLAYVTSGNYEELGAMAIVQKEDGFLSEECVEDLQVVQHGKAPVFNVSAEEQSDAS